MDYLKIYNKIIERGKQRIPDNNIKYENHHIVMRSMGGKDEKENLVLLTLREHFISHRLLWLIHRNKQTAWAFRLMCYKNKKWSSKIYEELKSILKHNDSTKLKMSNSKKGIKFSEEHKQNLSISFKGRPSSMKGKKFSTQHKLNLSKSKKGKSFGKGRKASEEFRIRMSLSHKGIKLSEDHKNNMKGKIPWNKNLKNSQIFFTKTILQFDLNNRFIKEWNSAKEASKYYNILNTGISQCCNGHLRSSGNFIWKFKKTISQS